MPDEPRTPDLVERARLLIDAFSHQDLDAMMSYFTPDAVWDLSAAGMETFEARAVAERLAEERG
jgi:ketosteroid isomerase-like protein